MNGVLHCAPKSLHWISPWIDWHLIFFMDKEKEKGLLLKEMALQGDIIYLHEDLTPTQVHTTKKTWCMWLLQETMENRLHRDMTRSLL